MHNTNNVCIQSYTSCFGKRKLKITASRPCSVVGSAEIGNTASWLEVSKCFCKTCDAHAAISIIVIVQ